jgi:hypothetical protein
VVFFEVKATKTREGFIFVRTLTRPACRVVFPPLGRLAADWSFTSLWMSLSIGGIARLTGIRRGKILKLRADAYSFTRHRVLWRPDIHAGPPLLSCRLGHGCDDSSALYSDAQTM